MRQVKQLARRIAYATGLIHLWYRLKALRANDNAPDADDHGVAIPPTSLINLVVGDVDWKTFLTTGAQDAKIFAAAIDRNGGDFRGAARILDFGCGCGRLARHLPALSDAEIYGVDYNGVLVDWCAKNLKGDFSKNELRPPLSFPDGHFDIVYLLSVFTHLRIATQEEWLAELARIIRPGGFAIITFHDEDHPNLAASGLTAAQLLADGALVHEDVAEGTNLIGVFQSRDFVRRRFGGRFDVAEIVPSHESGLGQAYAVLRRPAD